MWIAIALVLIVVVVVLIVHRWRQRFHYHTLLGRSFAPGQVKQYLHAALIEADRVLTKHQVTYWLDAGTLLGAYRSGGFIPWDDDLDICILHEDHDRLLGLAGEFQPPFRLIRISRWWSVDKLIPGLARWWPCETFLRLLDTRTQLYVDIFEAAHNSEDVLELLPLSNFHRPKNSRGDIYRLAKKVIFPLTEVAFEGRRYPAPQRVVEYLNEYYGTDLSPDHEWDAAQMRFVRRRASS